mmetsp:Transcript_12431/g.23517  ORF Transcript_12431/g.23517 Transcript_12431/m.23517 type:complete len:95 (-) Transcript_12431:2-286(-)
MDLQNHLDMNLFHLLLHKRQDTPQKDQKQKVLDYKFVKKRLEWKLASNHLKQMLLNSMLHLSIQNHLHMKLFLLETKFYLVVLQEQQVMLLNRM